MSDRTKLAVIDTISDSFTYGLKKLPSVLILSLTTSIIVFAPILALAYPMIIEFIEFIQTVSEAGGEIEPEALGEQIIPFIPIVFLLVIGSLLQYAIITSLIVRNITHGEMLWLFKINKNTFRYILASIVVGILIVAIYFAFSFLMSSAVIVVADNQDLQAPVIALSVLTGLILMVYFIVRLSLIPIDVVAQSNFAIGRGYRVTRGNVLRLVGLIIILIAALIVIAIVAQLVLGLMMLAAGAAWLPDNLEAVEQDPTILIDHFLSLLTSPIMIVVIVLSLVLDAFQTAIMTSAPVFAYRRLAGSA